MDERFDYVRKELSGAAERAAVDIAWHIARETGKHIGSDSVSVRARERLADALESFLSN